MRTTAATQAGFAAALRDPGLPLPAGLRCWNGSDPAPRFAVYRNNVAVALGQAMRSNFPVLCRHLGEACFDAVARAYIAQRWPRSPVLAEIGADFGAWLDGFGPLHAWPWLADLARLERARVDAWHAADAAVATPHTVAAWLQEPAALAEVRPGLHPSATLLTSRWSVATLWAVHQDTADPPPLDVGHPQAALVLRDPRDAVQVLPLAAAHLPFVATLAAGGTLADAADAVARGAPPPELATVLLPLLLHGALGTGLP